MADRARGARGFRGALVLAGLAAAGPSLAPSPSAPPPPERELVILTRPGPTTYHEGPAGPAGFEHDLAAAFARAIGARPRFVLMDGPEAILEALSEGKGDLGAAGLIVHETPGGKVRFGPVYQTVREEVVCSRAAGVPRGVVGLVDRRLVVPAGSDEARTLRDLRKALPALQWESPKGMDAASLVAAVSRGKWDCTLASSTLVALERRVRPGLKVAFDLGGAESLAWALPPGSGPLEAALRKWFEGYRASGGLDALLDRYYGFVKDLSGSEIRGFRADVAHVLPGFRPLFEESARRHDLRWTLLAALAYQESAWDPSARGPKGTAGMMMLAAGTARMFGVDDRLDPAQSIEAGAAYLARMRALVPSSVEGRDRDWFALAAYNIGVAHMQDALKLAARLGKNPDRWVDVREVLPLLSEDRYRRFTRYGFARGEITVEHVRSVRNYQDMLERVLGDGR